MREIKFRIYLGKSLGMRYFDFRGISGTNHSSYTLDSEGHTEWCIDCDNEDHDVTQYTGLKDRNGKDIYEGDIVHVIFEDKEEDMNEEFIAEIVYSEFSASFQLSHDLITEEFWADDDLWKLEVIGNIYENPDLLS